MTLFLEWNLERHRKLKLALRSCYSLINRVPMKGWQFVKTCLLVWFIALREFFPVDKCMCHDCTTQYSNSTILVDKTILIEKCLFLYFFINIRNWKNTWNYSTAAHLEPKIDFLKFITRYDGCKLFSFSCVNVAWSALFAESTSSPAERISAVKYSQIAVLLSVNVVPITEKISNGTQVIFTAVSFNYL